MWTSRVSPQLYPWIDGVQIKKKSTLAPVVVSAAYGAPTGYLVPPLTLPINIHPEMDIVRMWGKDPAFGQSKRLCIKLRHADHTVEDIIIDELNGKWKYPLYYHPEATLDLVVNGGLCNQIYQVATACLIAKRTYRRLAFPFRVLARKGCMEKVCTYNKPEAKVDVPFSHLFDAVYFMSQCGVKLCTLEEGDTIVTTAVVARDKEGKTVEERPMPDSRFLPEGTSGDIKPIESTEIPRHYYASRTHISLLFPFLAVKPATKADYDILVGAIFALRPAPRLQTIADTLLASLSADSNLIAVHCRVEGDWKSTFPGQVATASTIVDNIRRAHTATTVYVIGNTANETTWREMTGKAPEYKWIRKEDFGISDLGFEEGAVVDRDIACRVPYFLGFAPSSFSLAVVLQRHHDGKAYSFYDQLVTGISTTDYPGFFYKDGKPIRDKLP